MKKLLLSVLAIVALVTLSTFVGVTASNHYKNYQNKKVPAEPVISQRASDQKIAAVKSAAVADQRAQVEKFNGQVAECQKGKAAYDLLTASQKTRVAAPVCATPETL